MHDQLALEHAIRQRARVTAVAAPTAPAQVTPAQLRRQLAGSALVQYVEFKDRLWAVVVTERRCRVVAIGDSAPVRREIQLLRFGLRRLAMTDVGRARSIQSARLGAARSAAALFELLVRPLQRDIDGRRLVIIPTASLHSLPWAALPTLADVPLTVAPSATIWHRCMTTPAGDDGPVVLCAGPDLPDAEKEVVELGRHLSRSAVADRTGRLRGAAAARSGRRRARPHRRPRPVPLRQRAVLLAAGARRRADRLRPGEPRPAAGAARARGLRRRHVGDPRRRRADGCRRRGALDGDPDGDRDRCCRCRTTGPGTSWRRCTSGSGTARPRPTPSSGRGPTCRTTRPTRCRASSASARPGPTPGGPDPDRQLRR